MANDYIIYKEKSNKFDSYTCFNSHLYDNDIDISIDIKKACKNTSNSFNKFSYLKHLCLLKKSFGGIICVQDHIYNNTKNILINIKNSTIKKNNNFFLFKKILLMFIRGCYEENQWKIILKALEAYKSKDNSYTYAELLFISTQIHFTKNGMMYNTNHWPVNQENEELYNFEIKRYTTKYSLNGNLESCPKLDTSTKSFKNIEKLYEK